MTTAALYLRVSTEEQARHGYSLAGQREACLERALSLGASQVLEFADEGVSGALLQRPGLTRLREALRSGAVCLVVVMDPDRLARNLSHQLLLTEEIERAKARLEFVNFQWRNTPEGQLFYAVRGAIAQFEKEKIRERTSRGRQQKAKTGRLPLAFRPYGYDYNSATALLSVNEDEAAVVRRIFHWLVAEGEGPNSIARRLNHLGIPAKKGGHWHRNVVRQILRNPVYVGTFYANRYDTAGLGLNRHRPKDERVSVSLRPREEWIPIEVPAIISHGVWNQAEQVMGRARRLWAGRPRADYLLSGLIRCGRCGMSMTGQRIREWGRVRRVYTCRRTHQGAREGACGSRLDAEAVEQAVWDRLMARLLDPDALHIALVDGQDSSLVQQELLEIGQGLMQVEYGRANVIRALEQGTVGADALLESLRRLQEREASLTARRTDLERRLADATAGQRDLSVWRDMVQQWMNGPAGTGLVGDGRSGAEVPGKVGADQAGSERKGDWGSGHGPIGGDYAPVEPDGANRRKTHAAARSSPALAGPQSWERRQLIRTLITRVEAVEGHLTVFVRWPNLTAQADEERHGRSTPDNGEDS